MKSSPLLVLASLLVIALPLTAHALWTANGTVVCAANGNQMSPMVVPDGTGGVIIVWQDVRTMSDYDIYAQRMNAMGNAVWTGNGVAICTASFNQLAPRIVSDGAGGAIITWQDHRSNTNDDIYAQRIDAAGTVQWAANGVALCTAAGNQNVPAIVGDGAGGAIVSWSDARGANTDIYAQRINSAGAVQWTIDGVGVCTQSANQTNGSIVTDGANGAIVVWTDTRSGNDIYAQRVNSSGAAVWTANGMPMCTAMRNQDNPLAVSDGAGGVIAAWQDVRSAVDFDIYAQRLNSTGVPVWTADGVALCTATGDQTGPRIVTDGRNGAIVCWSDSRILSDQNIYAQRVDAAGTAVWTADGVGICTNASTQSNPAITADAADGAFISWDDDRSSNSDIYAQRVNASGTAQWASNGVDVVNFAAQQSNSAITSNGSDALLAWQDYRNANASDVFALRVGSGGTILTGVGSATPALDMAVGDNFPNPFSASATVGLTLRHAAAVSVEIFDATGHRVRTLDEGRRHAGASEFSLDGLDDHAHALPSGVYFYRVHAGSETVTKKMVIAR